MLITLIQTQYAHSDLHHLFWICGIIGSCGGAIGICVGVIKWMTAVWHRGGEVISHIDAIPSLIDSQSHAAQNLAEVKAAVDTIQTNHLAHLEVSSEKQIELLTSMDKSMGLWVDHSDKALTELAKMREDYQQHTAADKYVQEKIADRLDNIEKRIT